jgi:7-cyano-7-deazaguanine synthase
MTEDIKPRAVVLMSGGVDSTACAHFLLRDHLVTGLFVDYEQAARHLEWQALQRVAGVLNIALSRTTLRMHRPFGAGEIPGRNGLLTMLALAAGGYDSGLIVMGLHAGTLYYDCSPAFADRLDIIVNEYSKGRTRFLAPFLRWTKNDIYAYCRTANLDLSMTYSCEAGTIPPCGECLSCLDRARLDASEKT